MGCPDLIGVVFEAVGPTLNQLQWVLNSGTNSAKAILSSQFPGIGIGEAMQWFNTGSYGGPICEPAMVVFNDWGNPDALGGGVSGSIMPPVMEET